VERYQNCLDFSYEKKFGNYFERSFEFSAIKRLFCLMVHLSLLIRVAYYLSRQLLLLAKGILIVAGKVSDRGNVIPCNFIESSYDFKLNYLWGDNGAESRQVKRCFS